MMLKLEMSGFLRAIIWREHIIVMRKRGTSSTSKQKFFELKKIWKMLVRRNEKKICQMLNKENNYIG